MMGSKRIEREKEREREGEGGAEEGKVMLAELTSNCCLFLFNLISK